MSEASERYFHEQMQKMREQIDESTVFLGLSSPDWFDEPLAWAQLGYAVMKDKPVLLLVPRGLVLPRNVRRLALHIEEYASVEDLQIATTKLLTWWTENEGTQ